MIQDLFKLSLAFFTLFFMGCDNLCEDRTCKGRTDFVEFRLMRNDTNALFGPEAFVNWDSIQTYLAYSPLISTPVQFRDLDQTISLYMEEGAPVVLEINNVIKDTFLLITTQSGMDDCCLFYRADTILMNDQVICSVSCFSPIDIEL